MNILNQNSVLEIGRNDCPNYKLGQHYEVLLEAKDNHEKAINLFQDELSISRSVCEVFMTCMHGSPLPPYDNRYLWKKYDFRDCDIAGGAFPSTVEKDLQYLTGNGRTWCGRHLVRDSMADTRVGGPHQVESTDDLIGCVGSSREVLYLTVCPERWAKRGGVDPLLVCERSRGECRDGPA